MELIDRYVDRVAEYLPKDSDIPDELRSLLHDALEQRAAKAGRPPDQAMAVALVREFGEPEEVAWRYAPDDQPHWLIGPGLYPDWEAWVIGRRHDSRDYRADCRRHPTKRSRPDLYYRIDGHWIAPGHRAAADWLRPALQQALGDDCVP
jgi:hypothetical protein